MIFFQFAFTFVEEVLYRLISDMMESSEFNWVIYVDTKKYTVFCYKQRFYKQQQAEIDEKPSKS